MIEPRDLPALSREELLALVVELQRLLKPDGALAFSFVDPHYHSWPDSYRGDNLRWRLERLRVQENADIDIEGLARRALNADWCFLVNGRDLYLETENIEACEPELQKSCHVFYSEKHMKRLFPSATILPPVNNEMQHCCLIKGGSGAQRAGSAPGTGNGGNSGTSITGGSAVS